MQHQPNVNSFSRHRLLNVCNRYKNAGILLYSNNVCIIATNEKHNKVSSRNFCYRIYYVDVYIISIREAQQQLEEGNNICITDMERQKLSITFGIEVGFAGEKGNGFVYENIFILLVGISFIVCI